MEIFEFDYQLEVFKPAAKRRWGYWALPILHGDQMVGKLDVVADRDAGTLRVDVVHEDVELTAAPRTGIEREIRSIAFWFGLDVQML